MVDQYPEDAENLDKKELFDMYKEGEGLEYAEAIRKNVVFNVDYAKGDLKDLKKQYKDNHHKADDLKTRINTLKLKIEHLQKSAEEATEDKVIMEESFSLIKDLKDLKSEYQDKINKMKSAKSQIYTLEVNIKNVFC